MPITCKICGEEFENIIPYQHLSKHKITVSKYREQHGPNWAPDFDWKKFIQEKQAHRRGKKLSEEHVEKLKKAFEQREQKYQTGELVRTSRTFSAEQRDQASLIKKQYAETHPDKVKLWIAKAHKTRKHNAQSGLKPYHRGWKQSPELKQKIKNSLAKHRERQKNQTLIDYQSKLDAIGINITGRDGSTVFFLCQNCNYSFDKSLQNLQNKKFREDFCPNCQIVHKHHSQAETEIFELMHSHYPMTKMGDRSQITPYELDIWIPDLNIAIEYCGLYWHSELAGAKSSDYHRNKLERCRAKGIRLVTIFEDEWKHRKDTVLNMLNRLLQVPSKPVYARKCQIRELPGKTGKEFLEENHIHGHAAASYYLGLYLAEQLVYVMSFTKNNISRNNQGIWEIQRMAGLNGYQVPGAASRLFKYFLSRYNPDQVISYADLRWFTGDSYKNMGFEKTSDTKPGYWYIDFNHGQRKHRFSLRKNKDDNASLTEWQNRQLQGWDRIWDCGHAKWVWQKQNGQE